MQIQDLATRWRTVVRHRYEIVSAIVLAWSLTETASLAVVHHTGPELYGVLTAAVSAGTAAAGLALLRASRVHAVATIAVVVLFAVVALGGVAGVVAHVIGPVPGHGPVDLRPRPIAAPLVFTLLGIAGAAALVLGQRARARISPTAVKE